MEKNHRYFLMVAQFGSFKRAAAALYISQPSLTVAMKKLENDMGVTLFNRKPKGVELTTYGILLKEYALEQQEKQMNLMHRIHDMQQKQIGKIKIGSGEAWWELFVKQALDDYQIHHPTSSFHIEFGNNLSLVHHLVQGELDLVIGHEIQGLTEETRVSFTPLFQDKEAIYLREKHPLFITKDRPQAQAEDAHLKDYPLIRATPNHPRHQSILIPLHSKQNQLSEQQRMQGRVCYDVNSLSASIDILKSTDAVMPYTAELSDWFESRGLKTFAINPNQIGNIGLYSKFGLKDDKVDFFAKLLQKKLTYKQNQRNI